MVDKAVVYRKNIFYAVYIAVFLIFFYGYFYSDILITTGHGVSFWDVLFQGKIRDFYALCHCDVQTDAYHVDLNPGYDFLIYVLFGIWDFPLWIASRVFHIDIWHSIICMMWAKTIIIVFIVLTMTTLKRLCDLYGIEEKKDVLYFFLSSPYLASCAIVNSQYDIIISYFMLNGLYYLSKGDKKKFMINIAISAVLKPFSLLIYVPLILYYEKNVIKIMVDTICVLFLYLFLKIFIPNHTQLMTYSAVLTFFHHKINIVDVEVPIFFLLSFSFWILCYIYKPDEEKRYLDIFLISYTTFAIFFTTCGTNPYWCIMIVPFACILAGLNKKYRVVSILLDTVGSICLIGYYIINYQWCYDANILRTSYFSKLFGMHYDPMENIIEIIQDASWELYCMLDRISGFLFSLFAISTVLFLWMNMKEHKNITMEDVQPPMYLYLARIALALLICLIPMVAFFL